MPWLHDSAMDHDDQPVGTILSRRQAISLAAKSGFLVVTGGMLDSARMQALAPKVNLVAAPALEEGPFFVDEKLRRVDLVSGTSRKQVVDSVPLAITLAVHKLSGGKLSPFSGCQVDIWHCDAAGVYSDEDSQASKGQSWLRGNQITDASGAVKFKTVFPGWYPGRTTHIHFKIRKFSEQHGVTSEFTSQLFFHEADIDKLYAKPPYSGQKVPPGTNRRDGIFAQRQVDGSVAGDHLLFDLRPADNGYSTSFTIVLSDRSFSAPENSRGESLRTWDHFEMG